MARVFPPDMFTFPVFLDQLLGMSRLFDVIESKFDFRLRSASSNSFLFQRLLGREVMILISFELDHLNTVFVCTSRQVFPLVMAEPHAAAPTAEPATAPETEQPPAEVPPTVVTPVFEKRLLEAECNSLRSALLEEQRDVDPVVIHTPDLQAEDPAREQLKTLESLQNVMRATLVEQQRNMKVSMLQGRLADTVMKLQSKSIEGVEQEIKQLSACMERDVNVGQNVMDSVETTMDKVSTALGEFSTSVGTLADTLKDMAANQRTAKNVGDDQQRKMVNELYQVRDTLTHIRTNTKETSKEVKNCTWQLAELRRSGATDQNGAVSSQAGSLLFLNEDVKTAAQAVLEALGKSVTVIQETIEKGVHPDKSNKRKFEAKEAEDKERMARQKIDQEGQVESFFHPYTGQKMMLTPGQKTEFIKSLHLFQSGGEPMGVTPNTLGGTAPTMMPTNGAWCTYTAPLRAHPAGTGILPPGFPPVPLPVTLPQNLRLCMKGVW